jgi:Methyltransferase domain
VDLKTLPFDQYGRYRIIADALDVARAAIGRPLTVLDVGGYVRNLRDIELLPAQLFLPADQVTVVDLPASTLPGYVQGDGRGLAFADQSFDFVISCDTLEHVPSADRAGFWGELLRVARLGLLLIAPHASPEAVAAEQIVLQFIQAELGHTQLQLAEHAAYGLPDGDVNAALLEQLGLRQRSFPSGYLHAWLAMMIARHAHPVVGDVDLTEQLDAYYTSFFGAQDRCAPAYRRLWIVEKSPDQGWFERATDQIAATIRDAPPSNLPGWDAIVGWQLSLAAMRTQAQRASALEAEAAWRAEQVAQLERKVVWLERQAADANMALERVANGRVMRLLGKLRR